MILKAKYTGPYPEVTVPGFVGRTAKLGEVVTIRVPDGTPIGGCWEITEGRKEYQAALEKADKQRAIDDKARAAARAKAIAETEKVAREALPSPESIHRANGEPDYTKKAKPTGGAK